jgi:transcriptional regulator with XRE-family HTH domain
MDPGSSLRAARKRAGLTQSALAARAGTSQATISAYESGSKQPFVGTFSRLLEAMDARLAVEPAPRAVVEPSPAQLARAGAMLVEVLALAEALPVRHEPTLGFPPIARSRRRPA